MRPRLSAVGPAALVEIPVTNGQVAVLACCGGGTLRPDCACSILPVARLGPLAAMGRAGSCWDPGAASGFWLNGHGSFDPLRDCCGAAAGGACRVVPRRCGSLTLRLSECHVPLPMDSL